MPNIPDQALVWVVPSALLLGALLQIVVARMASARAKGVLAFASCLPALGAILALIPAIQGGGTVDAQLGGWDGLLALAIHVDALGVLFAFMGVGIGTLVLLYSIGYMAHEQAATRFFATMLLFIGGFVGLVFSANLFVLYLCWEAIGLCSFSLVGFWYTNPESVRGARKVLLMTHIAGYGLLAAILVLYSRSGSSLWTDPAVTRNFTGGVFALMLVALIAKSVQVPLHTWIPEAMAAPTPVSSLLHSACYVTAGVYLAARMHSLGPWPAAGSATLVWVGTITMTVGVMYAMVQTDLKRMLAFSTVSQIGYMMLGLGIGTPLAIVAGLLHCLNHGFFKGGLFLEAGAVQHAAGTRDMNQLGGLAQRMPRTTLWWLVGVGNMAGIPLMSGFVSKWMIYAAALDAGWAVPALVAWVVSLGTVFLCAKATSAVFLGPQTECTRDAHEAPATMQWGMGLMAAGAVVLGIAPQLAVNYLLNPVLSTMQMSSTAQVTWFGLFAGAGSFSTTGGLVLALVSLLVGGAIYMIAYLARPVRVTQGGAVMAGAGGGVFTGGEPLSERGRLTAGDFSEIFAQNWVSFFRYTNVDAAYLGLWKALLAVSKALGAMVAWFERRATLLVIVLAVAVFAVAGLALPTLPTAGATAELHTPVFLIAAIGAAALALFLAAIAYGTSKPAPLWLCMAMVGGLAVAGLLVANPWLKVGLLELATLLTAARVWMTARSQAAKWTYLAIVLISVAAAVAGEALHGAEVGPWACALLLTGVVVKLAAIPLSFWLLSLADELPALVLGLIIAIVDMAAFAEFQLSIAGLPGPLAPQSLLFGLAAATSLLAALLMLSQRSLKRLLVLSTIEDVGFLLLGLASATALGTEGALIAAATHALAKALLFICLSAPEAAGALEGESSGLAARFPVSGFGFLFGMLAMLGVPPTLGFVGRWRLYETALGVNGALAGVFIASSILALVAYVLALTRLWWGPAPEPAAEKPRRESWLVRLAIVGLVVVLLAGGLWPQSLQMLAGGGR